MSKCEIIAKELNAILGHEKFTFERLQEGH